MLRIPIATLVGICFVISLSGCATRPASLYQWQGYQKNVNDYFRADRQSLETQAISMEEDLQKIRASGGKIPPGYQAHIGLLYGKQGKLDQFAQQMENEKKQFPESGTFVDFLLRNFKK